MAQKAKVEEKDLDEEVKGGYTSTPQTRENEETTGVGIAEKNVKCTIVYTVDYNLTVTIYHE